MKRVIKNVALYTLIFLLVFGTSIDALASSVDPPDLISGNDGPISGYIQGKLEGWGDEPDFNTTYYYPDSSNWIFKMTTGSTSGALASWESVMPVYFVNMKGGSAYNQYDYTPGGATSDTDLVTPNNASGGPAGISHVSFYYKIEPEEELDLIVDKEVVYSGTLDISTWDFDFTSPGLTPSSFSLMHGEEQIFGDIDEGDYTITEDIPDGFELTVKKMEVEDDDGPGEDTESWEEISHTDGAVTVSVDGDGDDDDDTVYLRFVNTFKPGNLTLKKVVVDRSGKAVDATFDFDVTGSPFDITGDPFVLEDGETYNFGDALGTYTITESDFDVVPDSIAVTMTVNDGDPETLVLSNNGVTFDVGMEEDVVITFTNTYDPDEDDSIDLKVTKKIVDENGTTIRDDQAFGLKVWSDSYERYSRFSPSTPWEDTGLEPGVYGFEEIVAPGYQFEYMYLVTDSGTEITDNPARITLEGEPGSEIEVVIVNSKLPEPPDTVNLKVSKAVIDDSGREPIRLDDNQAFGLHVRGTGDNQYEHYMRFSQDNPWEDNGLLPGTYELEEVVAPGYEFEYMYLVTDSGNKILDNPGQILIDGEPDSTIEVVIVNSKIPEPPEKIDLKVTKAIIDNSGDAPIRLTEDDQLFGLRVWNQDGYDKYMRFGQFQPWEDGELEPGVYGFEEVVAPGYSFEYMYLVTDSGNKILDNPGRITLEGEPGSEIEVVIVNSKDPEVPDTIDLKVTKAIIDNNGDEVFRLTEDDQAFGLTVSGTGDNPYEKYMRFSQVNPWEDEGLIPGTYSFQEVVAPGYSFEYMYLVTDSGNKIIENPGELVLDGEPGSEVEVVIVNSINPTSLEIIKVVDGGEEEKTFTFTLNGPLGDNLEYENLLLELGNSLGWSEQVPAGDYTIQETVDGNYQTFIKVGDGEFAESQDGLIQVTVDQQTAVVVTYLNSWVDPGLGSLTIQKLVRDTSRNDTFTFRIVNDELEYDETVTISGAGTTTVSGLIPGVYTVSEISIPSNYDLITANNISVTVVENEVEFVSFTNDYDSPPRNEPDPTRLRIYKVVEDNDEAGDFTFILNGPDYDDEEIALGDGDRFSRVVEPGTYTIQEELLDDYAVEVTVDGRSVEIGDDGSIEVDVDDETTVEVTFTNTYIPPEEPPQGPPEPPTPQPEPDPDPPVFEEEGEPIIILEDIVPLGIDTLPQTGQAGPEVFYGFGSIVAGLGFALRKYFDRK